MAGPAPRSAMEIELNKLSSPRIFLVRMMVFLVLGILLVFAGMIGSLRYADLIRFSRSTAWMAGVVSGGF